MVDKPRIVKSNWLTCELAKAMQQQLPDYQIQPKTTVIGELIAIKDGIEIPIPSSGILTEERAFRLAANVRQQYADMKQTKQS